MKAKAEAPLLERGEKRAWVGGWDRVDETRDVAIRGARGDRGCGGDRQKSTRSSKGALANAAAGAGLAVLRARGGEARAGDSDLAGGVSRAGSKHVVSSRCGERREAGWAVRARPGRVGARRFPPAKKALRAACGTRGAAALQGALLGYTAQLAEQEPMLVAVRRGASGRTFRPMRFLAPHRRATGGGCRFWLALDGRTGRAAGRRDESGSGDHGEDPAVGLSPGLAVEAETLPPWRGGRGKRVGWDRARGAGMIIASGLSLQPHGGKFAVLLGELLSRRWRGAGVAPGMPQTRGRVHDDSSRLVAGARFCCGAFSAPPRGG